MSNLTTTNISNSAVFINEGEFEDGLLTFAGADTFVEGTILARQEVAAAVTPAADGGNTGDGTVTAATVTDGPIVPILGAHVLECTSAAVADGTATAAAAADGGNTGDGTVTSVTVAADQVGLEPGAYNLELIELGVKNGTAVGAAVADGGNTGDGTAGAVTAGSAAKAGDYIVTCIDATVSGSEVFSVFDPDGNRLEDLTVGVAYSNNHFGVTISDGATDFIVGDFWTITISSTGGVFKLEDPNGTVIATDIVMDAGAAQATAVSVLGLSFTITDGATDFVVGDKFAITVSNTGGLWKLEDPNGALLASNLVMTAGASQATVIEAAGLTFTITDGATDFVVGDKFTLTVATGSGKYVPFAKTGVGGAQIPKAILSYDITATGAGDVAFRAGIKGLVRFDMLVIDADGDNSNVDTVVKDQLRDYGITVLAVTELNDYDNQ